MISRTVNIGFRMLQKGCRSTVAAVVIAAAAISNNLENVAPDLQRVAAEQERLRYTRRYRFSPWPRGPQRRTVNCFVPTICPLPVH
jgi:hypothetical protein